VAADRDAGRQSMPSSQASGLRLKSNRKSHHHAQISEFFNPSLFVSSSVCWLVLRQKKKKKSEIELKRLPCPALPLLLRVALRWGGHGV
jgi:hypothetical protein